MADRAVFIRAPRQHLPDPIRDDRPRQRRIGRGQPLGDGHEIGLHIVVIGAKHRPQAAKACHHLIGHQQDVMALQHLLDRGPIALWWWHNAARAQDRLADKGRDGVSAFGQDQRLEAGCALGRKFKLGLIAVFATKVIGRIGVKDIVQRQIELVVKHRKPGHRPCHHPRAMIAAPARDDLFLLRTAKDVVVIPDQFDVGLIGIRP